MPPRALRLVVALALGCHGDPVASGGDATDDGAAEALGDSSALDSGATTDARADGTADATDAAASETADGGGTIYPFTSDPDCGAHKGGPMVFIAGGSFCIDAYEVTFRDYAVFKVDPSKETGKASYCSWNTTYGPGATFGDDTPVTGVNWCAAEQYCRWAGKHLCGKLTDGGPGAAEGPTTSQWTYACTQGGKTTWATGTTAPAGCINQDKVSAPQSVFSSPTCHATTAPYDRVFHLAGNVREWDGAGCEGLGTLAPSAVLCGTRGGYFGASSTDSQCVTASDWAIDKADGTVGFRCCKQAL